MLVAGAANLRGKPNLAGPNPAQRGRAPHWRTVRRGDSAANGRWRRITSPCFARFADGEIAMMPRTPQAQALIDDLERNWMRRHRLTPEEAWDWYDDALSMVQEYGHWPPKDPLHGLEAKIRLAQALNDWRVGGALRPDAAEGP
jgi:hypothetical protein